MNIGEMNNTISQKHLCESINITIMLNIYNQFERIVLITERQNSAYCVL